MADFGDEGDFMNGGMDGPDEVTEEGEQGPCGKMGSGICMMCVGFIFFPAMIFLLGYNEQRDVCEQKTNIYLDKSKEFGCASPVADAEGKDAFFSCPVDAAGLKTFTPLVFNAAHMTSGDSMASAISFKGMVGSQKAEMYQCREHKDRRTVTQNYKKVTITTYRYTKEWSDQLIDVTSFHRRDKAARDCGPTYSDFSWPSNFVQGVQTDHADRPIKSGPFQLSEDLIQTVRADKPAVIVNSTLSANVSAAPPRNGPLGKDDFTQIGSVLTTCPSGQEMGCFKVTYTANIGPYTSVFANIGTGGLTQPIKVPSAWGCSKSDYSRLWVDSVADTKTKKLASLKAERQTTTLILRILGVFGAWLGIYCCCGPVTAMIDIMGDCLDMIPFCGDMLESIFEGVAQFIICMMSMGVGCGAALCTIALVWVAMRPMVGIPLFIVSCCLCAGCVGLRYMLAPPGKKKGGYEDPEDQE